MAKEEPIDCSQYINCVDMRDARLKDIEEGRLRLQQLADRESAANEVLASDDSLPYERRNAQQVLEQCKARRARIQEQIDRAHATAEIFRKRIAAMEPEYQRQQRRIQRASALR